jgi:hypothetical protein
VERNNWFVGKTVSIPRPTADAPRTERLARRAIGRATALGRALVDAAATGRPG